MALYPWSAALGMVCVCTVAPFLFGNGEGDLAAFASTSMVRAPPRLPSAYTDYDDVVSGRTDGVSGRTAVPVARQLQTTPAPSLHEAPSINQAIAPSLNRLSRTWYEQRV